ncbi:MAG: metallophosphoesterase, partial [Candidatus Bathyarchaeia archaeon]
FREMINPLEYEVDEGKYRFFVVNSPQPDRDEGRLGRRRQSYLEERFRKLPADSFKILVFHHHLVPVPYSGRETNVLEDAGDILEMVLRFDVNLILMGHRHVRRVLRIEDTMLVNAGTLSSTRTRGRFGHSFNIIEIDSYGRVEVNEFNLG